MMLFGPLTRVLPALTAPQRDTVRSALERFSAWPFAVYRAFIGAVLLAGVATGWLAGADIMAGIKGSKCLERNRPAAHARWADRRRRIVVVESSAQDADYVEQAICTMRSKRFSSSSSR